jgi:hypothetical protein
LAAGRGRGRTLADVGVGVDGPAGRLADALLHVVHVARSSARAAANAAAAAVGLADRLHTPSRGHGGQRRQQPRHLVVGERSHAQPAPMFPLVPLPKRAASQFLPSLLEWKQRLEPIGFSGGWFRKPQALLQQIVDGVTLGYSGDRVDYVIRRNHPSAELPAAAAVVDKEFVEELTLGRMAGPFTEQQIRLLFSFFRTSPMAVVPKSDGSWRIIDDLSHDDVSSADPDAHEVHALASGLAVEHHHRSVNAHISDEEARVRYHSFDEAVRMVRVLGRGCWLAKVDWKSAFRQIAVCRDDWPLLGLQWRGHLFVRLVLPFGARSSPARFTQFAQAFAGMLRRFGGGPHRLHVMYYLDDFLLAGADASECAAAVRAMDELARRLGVTLHPKKRDGPAQVLTFLGIELDTLQMRMRLPAEKKDKVRGACAALLQAADGAASLHQLQSLVGLLLHASRVVQPGRLMTRRLIEVMRDMLRRHARPHERVQLPSDAQEDLQWWRENLDEWDGVSLIPIDDDWTEPIVVQTDAASGDGAGGVLFSPQGASSSEATALSHALVAWFYHPWSEQFRRKPPWSVGALEMAAIAIALDTFGPRLRGRCIRMHSDSSNAVSNMGRQAPESELNMRILRGIHAVAWRHCIRIRVVTHIAGVRNVFADAASRLSVQTPDKLEALGLASRTRLNPLVPAWLTQLAEALQQSSPSPTASL